MLNNKGFTLIELLISTVILVMSIVMVNSAYKQYLISVQIKERYENKYMECKLLINKILHTSLENSAKENIVDGHKAGYRVEDVIMNKSYVSGSPETQGGNYGNYNLLLYKINLLLDNENYLFYKTEFRRTDEENVPY